MFYYIYLLLFIIFYLLSNFERILCILWFFIS